MKVSFECLSGVAEIHKSRGSSQKITPADGPIECVVLDVPANVPDRQAWIKANAASAWVAAGVGQYERESGVVAVTAVDGDVVVREYLNTSAFASPDAEAYEDHVLKQGESLSADAIGANAETLLVTGPA